ncbi:hypothetical protein F5Y17DRAFT_471575 [Xylariaceae sp. FL0594]|nr:hypothetical protein F5Y17DRAFT_471575 [Xylariaceae sp. FL0594]
MIFAFISYLLVDQPHAMASNVYLGVWTNWARGPVFGSTLTTTKESGNLLIAFTATFIGFVASRLWVILCLCLHRCYSTQQPRNVLHHQRRIMLRNPVSPEASLSSIVQALWAWRSVVNAKAAACFRILQLGAKSLESQSRLYGGIQSPLPNDQWQTDVKRPQFNSRVISTAEGNPDTQFRPYISPPLNDAERKLCNSQKIKSTAYASFSLFFLLLTYVTGILIICVSFALEPLLGCLHRRRKCQTYAYLDWTNSTSLQLHRLGHDDFPTGLEWKNCTGEVPTTMMDPELCLPGLDIRDPNHPVYYNNGIVKQEEQSPCSAVQSDGAQHNDDGGASNEPEPEPGPESEPESEFEPQSTTTGDDESDPTTTANADADADVGNGELRPPTSDIDDPPQ